MMASEWCRRRTHAGDQGKSGEMGETTLKGPEQCQHRHSEGDRAEGSERKERRWRRARC